MLAREGEEKQEEEEQVQEEEEEEQVRLLHLWTFLLILAFSIFCMLSEGRHGMMGQSTGNRDQIPGWRTTALVPTLFDCCLSA